MSIIEKVFRYEETRLPIIKYKDEIWFRGKTVAGILGYAIQHKAIREHIDPEDRVRLTEPHVGTNRSSSLRALESKGSILDPLKRNEGNAIYINEPGLYSPILRSKLESACVFKRWVTKDVLPSIRKTGRYIYDDRNHKYSDILTFKIENESDFLFKEEVSIQHLYCYIR